MYQFAFSTDIVKMFRKIRIYPKDTDLQRILRRTDPAEEVREFILLIVTYSMLSVSFLTIRYSNLLMMKSISFLSDYWQSEKIHVWMTYYSGGDIMQEALASKTQTETLLIVRSFELSRWIVSHKDLAQADNSQGYFQILDEWMPLV